MCTRGAAGCGSSKIMAHTILLFSHHLVKVEDKQRDTAYKRKTRMKRGAGSIQVLVSRIITQTAKGYKLTAKNRCPAVIIC